MGSIKITNISPGRLVVNSVKLVILPGQTVIKDESLASDSDIQELEGMKRITVEPVDKPAKADAPQTAGQPAGDEGSAKPQGNVGKGKGKSHHKKMRHGKTTPKKTEPQGQPAAPVTPPADAERTRQENELNSEVNQMGRTAVIVDRGVVRKQPMGPGLHSTGEPIVPSESKTAEDEEDGTDKPGSPFVSV
jgi:hypothetical protein